LRLFSLDVHASTRFLRVSNGVACRPFIVYWVIRVISQGHPGHPPGSSGSSARVIWVIRQCHPPGSSTRVVRVIRQGHPGSETNKRPRTDRHTYPNPEAFFPPNYFLEQFHSNCEDTKPSKLSNLNIYKASEIVLLFEQIGLASKRTFKKTVIPMTAVQYSPSVQMSRNTALHQRAISNS